MTKTWAELRAELEQVLQPYQLDWLDAPFLAQAHDRAMGVIEGTFVEVVPEELRLGSGVDDHPASG